MRRRSALLAPLAFAVAACADLGGFSGAWSGVVVTEPALLVGMPATAKARLAIAGADRIALDAALLLDGRQIKLRPIARAMGDGLGSLSLPDKPLRSYLLVAALPDGDALAVVSLYEDDHVDLRLLRSDTLYAVFHLTR